MGTVPGYIAEMQLTNIRPNLSNLLSIQILPAAAAIHAAAACAARTAGTARAAKRHSGHNVETGELGR